MFGIFTTVYGGTDFKGIALPYISTGFELSVGRTVYSYSKLALNYRFGRNEISSVPWISTLSIQAQTGAGVYLFDRRSLANDRGWSMVMNFSLGFGVNFSGENYDFDGSSTDYPIFGPIFGAISHGFKEIIYLPVEIAINTRYHFSDRSAFIIGVNLGGFVGFRYSTFVYGLNLGFAF